MLAASLFLLLLPLAAPLLSLPQGSSFLLHRAKANHLASTSTLSASKKPSFGAETADDMVPFAATSVSRRDLLALGSSSSLLLLSTLASSEIKDTDYGLWGVLPLGPYKSKPSILSTVVPGQIWSITQKFGILNVQVPIRMVVAKLKTGGLLVYNPVATTRQVLSLLAPIVEEHGPVEHVVLGSVALEHKAYASVFAQKFPSAKVWIQPGQYAFPINLSPSLLGFPTSRTSYIPSVSEDCPWHDTFDTATLGPLISRDGAYGETVLHHRSTRTLLVTDVVQQVTKEVPAIFDTDPSPLMYHARSTVDEVLEDTPATRERGWRRVVLFALFFQPAALKIQTLKGAIAARRPDVNPDFAGIYPWCWEGDDKTSFKALTGEGSGGLLVAPILRQLILNRNPVETREFVDIVAKWNFKTIVPAHLKETLEFTGKDFKDAFGFLTASGMKKGLPDPLPLDLALLREIDVNLVSGGVLQKAPPLVGTKGVTREDVVKLSVYECRGEFCTTPFNKIDA